MARERLQALRFPTTIVDDVVRLVEMHLRFHGYSEWTDSAVRRYVRDAGPLLDPLNQLTRADCTTQNRFKAKKLEALQDDLEDRIARLAEEENLDALRPPIDGRQVMEHLGIAPGPHVGRGPRPPDGAPPRPWTDRRGRGVPPARRVGDGRGAALGRQARPPAFDGGQITMKALPITLSVGTKPRPNRLSAEFPRLSPITNSEPAGIVSGP